MQFSTIYGEVASNFPTANVGRCKLAVQAAYHEWVSGRQWSFRESSMAAIALVAGTSRFTLLGTTPVVTDFDGMIDVNLELTASGAQHPLSEMNPSVFDQVFGHVKVNSTPAVYCIQGGAPATTPAAVVQGGQQQLVISPPPIATAGNGVNLILRYFRSVGTVELSADTDVPIMPAQYHYALVIGGNAWMATALGNAQKAQEWRQLFMQRLQEAMSSDQGMRMRDSRLLEFRAPASVYPITGQTPPTFDPGTRPYDPR